MHAFDVHIVEDHYGKTGDPYSSNSISFHPHHHHTPQSTKPTQSIVPPKFMERLPMTSRKRGSDSNHQTPAQDRQDAFPPVLPVPSSYRQLFHRSKQHSHQNAAGPTFSHRSGRPHSRMRTNSSFEVVGGGDMAYRKHPGTSSKNKGT